MGEMEKYSKERLLIISNNVVNNTSNNGKTILSFFENFDKNDIRQLYFSEEKPIIQDISYFQLNDKDVIKGRFNRSKRGRTLLAQDTYVEKYGVIGEHSQFKRLCRELLWVGAWKSKQLFKWLDEFSPTAIFFVGGDCVFAYKIAMFIAKRYNAKFSLYITDDYVLKRKYDCLFGKIRRHYIAKNFKKCLSKIDSFFTVSDYMKEAYKREFNKDSFPIVNMSEDLKDNSYSVNTTSLIYAGSLYYGRDKALGLISSAVENISKESGKPIEFDIYTTQEFNDKIRDNVIKGPATKYCGALNPFELKKEFNKSSILVFVESFDKKQIEKVKYSLSTKITEYLSLEKPIFAVGPSEVGSMVYLKDVALCVNDVERIESSLKELILSNSLSKNFALLSREKYLQKCCKENNRKEFLLNLFGY